MLSEDLKNLIRNLYQEYGSYRKVATLAKVNDKTVRRIVLDLYVQDKQKPGPKPEISQRETSKIKRASTKITTSGQRLTAPRIQQECNLQRVSTRTVQRKLKSMGMVYKNVKKSIILTPAHKETRLQKARQWIEEGMDWNKVVWTDEKRFNADGPDSWRSWMPKDKPLTRNKRQQGGPSIQVWGALLPGPFLLVMELPERGDSKDFMDFLEEQVLPLLANLCPPDFIFQQDRAPTHTSSFSLARFAELGINLLDWPSRSPDLNVIENCWSMLEHRVYNGRQFSDKHEIWQAIDSAVTDLNVNCLDHLNNLRSSPPKRLLQVIERKGAKTDY